MNTVQRNKDKKVKDWLVLIQSLRPKVDTGVTLSTPLIWKTCYLFGDFRVYRQQTGDCFLFRDRMIIPILYAHNNVYNFVCSY